MHAQKSIRCSQPAQSLLLAQQHCPMISNGEMPREMGQSRYQQLKHRARSEAPRAGSMQMPREMRPGSAPAAEASSQVGGSTCWEHEHTSGNTSEAPRAGYAARSAPSRQVGGSTSWEHANTLRNKSGAPRAGSRVGTGINQFAETD